MQADSFEELIRHRPLFTIFSFRLPLQTPAPGNASQKTQSRFTNHHTCSFSQFSGVPNSSVPVLTSIGLQRFSPWLVTQPMLFPMPLLPIVAVTDGYCATGKSMGRLAGKEWREALPAFPPILKGSIKESFVPHGSMRSLKKATPPFTASLQSSHHKRLLRRTRRVDCQQAGVEQKRSGPLHPPCAERPCPATKSRLKGKTAPGGGKAVPRTPHRSRSQVHFKTLVRTNPSGFRRSLRNPAISLPSSFAGQHTAAKADQQRAQEIQETIFCLQDFERLQQGETTLRRQF